MQAKRRMAYTGFFSLAVFIALLTATVAAQISLPDVGLITKLSGEATYWNKDENKKPAKVRAFMKVRRGDHLQLPAAAGLTLLYFASGRQETWEGPATFLAGDTESAAVGDQKTLPRPAVKIFPAKATKQIVEAPLPLSPASMSKSAVIQTMTPKWEPAAKTAAPLSSEDQQKIKEAEKVYQDMKKSATADDITPELYFFSVMAEYKQFPEMAKMVDVMVAKRPRDKALKALKSWVWSEFAAGD